ncbi:MAG: hypothetical protein AAGK01_12155 [Pseudomonadota bacterium]
MRAVVDVIDSIGASIRFIVMMFFLAIFAFGALIAFGATYVAPQVADTMIERAAGDEDRYNSMRHDREMGGEGWGYGSGSKAAKRQKYVGEFGEDNGGWAEEDRYRR